MLGPAAWSRQDKNITPARARRGERPPRGNVLLKERRAELAAGYGVLQRVCHKRQDKWQGAVH